MKKRTLALMLALVLVIGCAVGATVAWLTDVTEPVKNTFTTSDVDIELAETTGTEYKMVPGSTIAKNPVVTVKAGSEACYLFVKVEKSANFDYYMEYTMVDGWYPLASETDVYYREVDAATAATGKEYHVLANDQVTVKTTVTKEMMDAFDADKNGELSETEKASLPTLTFTAYACQSANVANVATAWGYISNSANS